jgi:hypothetical protein
VQRDNASQISKEVRGRTASPVVFSNRAHNGSGTTKWKCDNYPFPLRAKHYSRLIWPEIEFGSSIRISSVDKYMCSQIDFNIDTYVDGYMWLDRCVVVTKTYLVRSVVG